MASVVVVAIFGMVLAIWCMILTTLVDVLNFECCMQIEQQAHFSLLSFSLAFCRFC